MKKIFIILFFSISLIFANHIKWQGNYSKALKKARDTNKVLMVLLIKNNCLECKNIVRNIFTNQLYLNELNNNVIAVIVNIDNKYNFPIEMYWSNEYPTLFFVDSHNEIFINKPLYKTITKDEIKNILNKIKHNNEKNIE